MQRLTGSWSVLVQQLVATYYSDVVARVAQSSRSNTVLPRKHRATSGDLEKMGRGKAIRTKHILFSYTPAPVGTKSKIACSVAKKVAKLAVDRNRLKRQCRAALAGSLSLPHTSIVGIARIMDSKTTWDDLDKEVKEIFAVLSRQG